MKTLCKTLTWRLLGTAITITIAWAITGKLSIAIGIGIWETLVKTIVYYLHEKVWGN